MHIFLTLSSFYPLALSLALLPSYPLLSCLIYLSSLVLSCLVLSHPLGVSLVDAIGAYLRVCAGLAAQGQGLAPAPAPGPGLGPWPVMRKAEYVGINGFATLRQHPSSSSSSNTTTTSNNNSSSNNNTTSITAATIRHHHHRVVHVVKMKVRDVGLNHILSHPITHTSYQPLSHPIIPYPPIMRTLPTPLICYCTVPHCNVCIMWCRWVTWTGRAISRTQPGCPPMWTAC